uniref:Ig-like domain-containing protein n=1 Tax=Sus scrofa TaxID=9823 RepID=A0A8D1UG05_PIG
MIYTTSFSFSPSRMGSSWVPWVVALLVTVIRLDSSMTQGRDSPASYHMVRLYPAIWRNERSCIYYPHPQVPSDLGKFVALTELGQPDAELWNSRPDILESSRASVDVLCRRNYWLGAPLTVERKVQPEVTVHPERTPSLQLRNLLLCSVTGFYPGAIEIRWFRNGQEQREGVLATGLVRNGDWTFQTVVMLEMTPELGDVYTCLVDHPSLLSPVSVEWRAQSDCSWTKLLIGVAAFLGGLTFLLVGIIIHVRARKGRVETQLSGDEPH